MEIICQTPSSPFSQSSSDESWKYVREGFDLLAKSAEELAPFSPKKSTNLAFARQLHLDGVGYILKSLPADLKPEEQLILQSSLPSSILADEREIQRTLPASGESPPYFQKCIKGFIIQLFLVFQYLLPYLQHFIQISLEYERSHKISERLFRASMAGLNYAITRVFEIRERVSTMSDGRAEEVVIDSVGWCFVNILGGLYNGCREGMVNLKEDRDRSRLA
ncbi:MAG: hypothetical protein M1814_001153 [Vezdaea aestivalis]|nr:MAG: hypothetical protein M1814_001153 [Vezdaea aestivalis]